MDVNKLDLPETNWRLWINSKLDYWFVQYNPFYFFSALCLVFGVFLVSRGLSKADWQTGKIILTGIMEIYQVMLLVGAAILLKYTNKKRPSVVLCIIAICFLFDATYQTEVISSFKKVGAILTACWLISTTIKVNLIIKIFKIRISKEIFILILAAAAAISISPHIFSTLSHTEKKVFHTIMTWVGIIIFLRVYMFRAKIQCDMVYNEYGRIMFRQISRATLGILTAMYLYHLISWFRLYNITPTIMHFLTLILLFAVLSKEEIVVWVCSLLPIYLAMQEPVFACPIAFIAGTVLCIQARRLHIKRLYVGAVTAFYFVFWTMGWKNWPLPEQNLYLTIVFGIILLSMAWFMELKSALIVVIAGMMPQIKTIIKGILYSWSLIMPDSSLKRGMLLLFISFMALALGVAINLWGKNFQSTPESGEKIDI